MLPLEISPKKITFFCKWFSLTIFFKFLNSDPIPIILSFEFGYLLLNI